MLKIMVQATEEQRKALLSRPNSLLAKAMLAGKAEADPDKLPKGEKK